MVRNHPRATHTCSCRQHKLQFKTSCLASEQISSAIPYYGRKPKEAAIFHQLHFTLGGYYAVTIHACLYNHNCYNSGSDALVREWCRAALQCNGYGLKSLLAWHLDKGSVHWREGWYVNVQSSVHWGCKMFLIHH